MQCIDTSKHPNVTGVTPEWNSNHLHLFSNLEFQSWKQCRCASLSTTLITVNWRVWRRCGKHKLLQVKLKQVASLRLWQLNNAGA